MRHTQTIDKRKPGFKLQASGRVDHDELVGQLTFWVVFGQGGSKVWGLHTTREATTRRNGSSVVLTGNLQPLFTSCCEVVCDRRHVRPRSNGYEKVNHYVNLCIPPFFYYPRPTECPSGSYPSSNALPYTLLVRPKLPTFSRLHRTFGARSLCKGSTQPSTLVCLPRSQASGTTDALGCMDSELDFENRFPGKLQQESNSGRLVLAGKENVLQIRHKYSEHT